MTLKEHKEEYRKSLTKFNNAVRKAYPIGKVISVVKGKSDKPRILKVAAHNDMDYLEPRLWVHNELSGKSYWLDSYYFV